MRTITDETQIADELASYAKTPSGIIGLFVWRECRAEDQRTRYCIARTVVNRCAFAPARGFERTPADNILQPDTYDSFRQDNPAHTHFPEDSDVTFQQCVHAARSALGIIHDDLTLSACYYHGTQHNGPAAEWGTVGSDDHLGPFYLLSTSMNKLIAAFLFCAASAFGAVTTVTTCATTTTISSAGLWIIANDINATTADCFTITGQNQPLGTFGYSEIDCAGHAITLGSGRLFINAAGNSGSVLYKNCRISKATGFQAVVHFINSATASGNYIVSANNTYAQGMVQLEGTPHFYSSNDTVTNGKYSLTSGSTYSVFNHVTIDDSALLAGVSFDAGIQLDDGQYFWLNDVTIKANPGTSYPGNMDDGVTFGSQLSSCGSVCVGGIINNLTVYDVYDAGVETTGKVTGLSIINSNFIRPEAAGYGCYGSWSCGLANSMFANNTVIASTFPVATTSTTGLFFIDGTSGTDFTNNTFVNNKIVKGGAKNFQASYIGDDSQPFRSASGNLLIGNDFGTGGVVFQTGSGVIDGGNKCAFASPVYIACH